MRGLHVRIIAGYCVTIAGKPADRHNYPTAGGVEDSALRVWALSAWRYARALRAQGHACVAIIRLQHCERYTICRSF
jgi:hypothetical protein